MNGLTDRRFMIIALKYMEVSETFYDYPKYGSRCILCAGYGAAPPYKFAE